MRWLSVAAPCILLAVFLVPAAQARVDARFIIHDENGTEIYMINERGRKVPGTVLAGQKVMFDASSSNSAYPVDRFHWDFDYDGVAPDYSTVNGYPVTSHTFERPGTYRVYLLAVASTAPPSGDGDTLVQNVIVVDDYVPPVACINDIDVTRRDDAVVAVFNASESHDPDGYVRLFNWDGNGDGTVEVVSRNNSFRYTYTANGFYRATLEVQDYNDLTDRQVRVIHVDDLDGEMATVEATVTVKNKRGETVGVIMRINNNEWINASLETDYSFKTTANPALNELYVAANGLERVFFFEGDAGMTLEITPEDIREAEEYDAPATGLSALVLVFVLALFVVYQNRGRISHL
jgi:PKD repeat protein